MSRRVLMLISYSPDVLLGGVPVESDGVDSSFWVVSESERSDEKRG